MQFMNVTLFKQSPLSAKQKSSNQSGQKTRSAEQRTKFKPYVRLSSESNMQDIR